MRKIRATYTSESRADEASTTSVEWIAAEVRCVEAAAPGTRVEVYGTGRETVLAKLKAAVPVATTAKTASASAMLDVGVDVVNGRDTVATFGAAVYAVPWVAVVSDTAMLTRYAAWCFETADAIRKNTGPNDPLHDLAYCFQRVARRDISPHNLWFMHMTLDIRTIQRNLGIVLKAAPYKEIAELSRYNNKGEWANGELAELKLGLGRLGALSAENRARVARLRRVIARCQVVFDGWIDRVDAECAARERREEVKPVQIGSQWWASRNVRATIMSDGTKITWARDLGHFAALTASKRPAWIYSEDEVLYNPYVDFTKLCPVGYRVPTTDDWDKLSQETCRDGEEKGVHELVNGAFQAKLVGCVSERPANTHKYVWVGITAGWWIAIADEKFNVSYVTQNITTSTYQVGRVGPVHLTQLEAVGNGLRLIRN
jgi:uncharacterized protein (TIGR02145 family)